MSKFQKTAIAVVGVILVALIIATVAVFVYKQNDSGFVPPEADANALSGYPTVIDEYAQYQNIRMNEDFAFSMALCPLYVNGKAEVYFANSKDSKAYGLIKLYDSDGNLIGESGLVKPGKYVQSVEISLVPKRDTEISVRVLSYEPKTYYSLGTVSGKLSLRMVN